MENVEVLEDLVTEGGSTCPVCRHRPAAMRIDLGDYRLFECPGCGCWSSDALIRSATVSFEPVSYFANTDADRTRWEGLANRIDTADTGVGSVLDVGCGNGAYLEFVGQRLPNARREGIELDPDRAAEAAARNPDARIHVGDARACLPQAEGPFDLITLWDVFEHVPAPAQLLVDLAALVAPAGRIYIQTIHEDSLVPRLGKLAFRGSGGRVSYPARRSHEPHHLAFFSRRGLRLMADRAGLDISDLWFDRLDRERMDGSPLVVAATSALLMLENLLGNGLFVNLILEPAELRESGDSSPRNDRTRGRAGD